MSSMKDRIKGGFADGMTAKDVAEKHGISVSKIEAQIKKGKKVEMEHVDDSDLSEEIALDHLYEIPDYYDRLKDMEKEAKKEMKEKGMKTEGKENITEFARRMRELAGLAEGNEHKSLKAIQEGDSSFEEGMTFLAKDMMTSNNKESINEAEADTEDEEEFETHEFEQKTIEEGENDEELYTLNENTIIVLDFMEDEETE